MDFQKITERQPPVSERHCIEPVGSFTLPADNKPMKLNCIVVDDAPQEVTSLIDYLKLHDQINFLGHCHTAEEAVTIIENEKVDLLFIDIRLQGLNGLDLAKIIPPTVLKVFISSYPEHALESFKSEPLHFLVKPLKIEDCLSAISRAVRFFERGVGMVEELDHFYIRVDKNYRKIKFDDVLIIEGEHEFCKIFLGNEQILVLVNMKSMFAQLQSSDFLRVHRSYIINTKHIKKFNTEIIDIGEYSVPIGRTYKESVTSSLLSKTLIER